MISFRVSTQKAGTVTILRYDSGDPRALQAMILTWVTLAVMTMSSERSNQINLYLRQRERKKAFTDLLPGSYVRF